MSNNELSMGEATKAVQGYPTQVWAPTPRDRLNFGYVALVHDRREQNTDPGVFVLAGNPLDRLVAPRSEVHTVLVDGNVKTVHLPDWTLWDNHGGPCRSRGDRVCEVPEDVIETAYLDAKTQGKLGQLAASMFNGKYGYEGPLDYSLTDSVEKLKIRRMNPELFPGT